MERRQDKKENQRKEKKKINKTKKRNKSEVVQISWDKRVNAKGYTNPDTTAAISATRRTLHNNNKDYTKTKSEKGGKNRKQKRKQKRM